MKWSAAQIDDLIRTETENGAVFLGRRRVLLLDAESLRRLRDRLIETEGVFGATTMLWNFSYAIGFQDAISVNKRYERGDKLDWFKRSVELLALRGMARIAGINGSLDRPDGERLLEVEWANSWEIRKIDDPARDAQNDNCIAITGYLSGFASAVTGKNIMFLHTECRGRGDARCFAAAKSEWKDDDEEVRLVQSIAEDATQQKFKLSEIVADNNPTIERIRQLLTEIESQRAEIETLQTKVQYLQEIGSEGRPVRELIGSSAAYKKAIRAAQTVAPTDSTVLIQGETGTGKELFARYIRANSQLKNRPLVTVNCAALPASLVESELFGHERGAFTGAAQRKLGRFEIADGGTIFLDEVGELPPETQVKFLRVLQEGEFQRVGGTQTIKANVRVIAATNQNLEELVHEGKFRSDLFYRLNVFPITVPPLRERAGDIAQLVNFFAQKYKREFHKPITSVSRASIDQLKKYDFPGNVRELQHIVERSVLLSEGEVLEIIVPVTRARADQAVSDDSGEIVPFEEMERRYIQTVLRHTGGVIAGKGGAAELMGMPPSTLRSRMKKLGIR